MCVCVCVCVQMMMSSVKGCVSVGQEGNTYSQNAELRWDNRSVKQGMKYQVFLFIILQSNMECSYAVCQCISGVWSIKVCLSCF